MPPPDKPPLASLTGPNGQDNTTSEGLKLPIRPPPNNEVPSMGTSETSNVSELAATKAALEEMTQKFNELTQSHQRAQMLAAECQQNCLKLQEQLKESQQSHAKTCDHNRQLKGDVKNLRAEVKELSHEHKSTVLSLERALEAAIKSTAVLKAEIGNEFMELTLEANDRLAQAQSLKVATDIRETKLNSIEKELEIEHAALEKLHESFKDKGANLGDIKLQLRNTVESAELLKVRRKLQATEAQMEARDKREKDNEAFLERTLRLLRSVKFDDEGSIVAWVTKVEAEKEPERPVLDEAATAQIFKEGKLTGYFEYAKDYAVVCAMKSAPGTTDSLESLRAKYRYLIDHSNPRHPFGRGKEIGYLFGGALAANHVDAPKLDPRLWSKHTVTAEYVDRHNFNPPEKGTFWAGFLHGTKQWLEENQDQFEKAKAAAVGHA